MLNGAGKAMAAPREELAKKIMSCQNQGAQRVPMTAESANLFR